MRANAADRKKASPPIVTVQILNLAEAKPSELENAITEASWIFGKAGVKVNWVHCGPDPCREDEDALTFSLGLVTKVPDFLRETGMGFALVYSGERNHAGVVYSRVVELARANSLIIKPDQVLAYAMVHEIAHLMLGSTAHSSTGIMRAGCRPAELTALSQRRLLFGRKEIEDLHRKLLERSSRVELSGARRVSVP